MSKEFSKLEKDPIMECVSEFRFDTHLDENIAFAILLQSLKSSPKFNSFNEIPQPIMQLPPDIRRTDPQLKFQPCYLLTHDNFTIGVSSHSLLFSLKTPYSSFNEFSTLVKDALCALENKYLKGIYRVSLRYINKIQDSLFEATNLSINGIVLPVLPQNAVNLRIESLGEKSITTVLQLNNNSLLTIIQNGKPLSSVKASVVDIDAIYNIEKSISSFNDEELFKALAELHEKTHSIFFDLFKPEYIKKHFDESYRG